MKWFKSRQFFTLWFGFGFPPFLVGAVYFAFLISPVWGWLTVVITAAWLYESFSTTCSRCQFYGSGKCGIPGLIVPFFFKKKSAFSISINRVKLHYFLDIAMIFYINFIYAHFPWIFPFVAIGAFGSWLIVFRKKRFHGLLWRLNLEPKVKTSEKAAVVIVPLAELR